MRRKLHSILACCLLGQVGLVALLGHGLHAIPGVGHHCGADDCSGPAVSRFVAAHDCCCSGQHAAPSHSDSPPQPSSSPADPPGPRWGRGCENCPVCDYLAIPRAVAPTCVAISLDHVVTTHATSVDSWTPQAAPRAFLARGPPPA